jgi:hypothetical protein
MPFELYVKNGSGKEFTVHANITNAWENGQLELSPVIVSIVPERWSRFLKTAAL